jgi:hypothetical protein
MQTLSLADHFSSPVMTAFSIAFVVIEILSILLFFVVTWQFHTITRKHSLLPSEIGSQLEEDPELGSSILFWAYVVLTVIMTIATTLLFFWQPHLY